MTYGYRPDEPFVRELARRGVAASDIERVELRPLLEAPAGMEITVTLRSGRIESWRHPRGEEET